MSSSKGAIKKTIESKSELKSQRSSLKAKIKTSTSQSVIGEDNEAKEKAERIKKKLETQKSLTESKSNNKNQRDKIKIVSDRSNILPDKNIFKSKQNAFPSNKAGEKLLVRQAVSKTKSHVKLEDKAKNINSKNEKIKVQKKTRPLYDEVRGTSSIYAPKDAASKFRTMTRSMEKTRKIEDKSKKIDKKILPVYNSRERKNSRTLTLDEIKVLKPAAVDKTRNIYDDDDNSTKIESDIDEDTYRQCDDDFEDYESNFSSESSSEISERSETTSSSMELEPIELYTEQRKRPIVSADVRKREEEHGLDSGHYELTEAKKRALMVNRMKMSPPEENENQLLTINKEEKQFEVKSLPSSTDEGFEDLRSGDFVKSPPIFQIVVSSNEKSEEALKNLRPKKLTRGQILMSMIKLDTIEWSLYESTPISYDEFIRTFGKLNTQQTCTQTNEDNLDVEVQTDVCELENKWTQFPVKCRNTLKTVEDVRLFKNEHVGVGGDNIDKESFNNPTYDVLKLNEFLSKAGKVMLALLEEKESGGNILQNETHEFPFSEGFINLSISSLSFLCGRQVTMLQYSKINNKILMSIHAPIGQKTDSESKQDYVMDCCIGCIWNVNEPSRPIKLFYSPSPITACCFHCTNNNIVFAGLEDGSICLWDLREEEMWHQKIIDKIHEMNWIIRSPTYTTAGNWDLETAHNCSVISVCVISKIDENETENLSDKFVSIQICSLDEDGHLIIWSVLHTLSTNTDDLGLTQWGKVKLIKSQEVPLFKNKNVPSHLKKQFIDMNVDNVDSNNLYLATNSTDIFYANCLGAKNNTNRYKINEIDSCGNTTCIEVCPFKQSYFFAGCNDGSIRLHSLNTETPILKIKDENTSIGIKSIEWSRSKPLTFYVLDDHSKIAVWDLNNSDIHPIHNVSTKTWGYVKCMRLSPCNTNRDMMNQYLALGTDTGNIEVHKLKKDFYFSQQEDFLEEMNTFLRYVSIL